VASYLVAAAYDDPEHAVSLEVYLEGPDDLDAGEVDAVFREMLSTGEVPEGWHFNAALWDHGRGEGELDDVMRFGQLFRTTDLDIIPLEARGVLDDDDDLEGDEDDEE
jgi:hypothetical protein